MVGSLTSAAQWQPSPGGCWQQEGIPGSRLCRSVLFSLETEPRLPQRQPAPKRSVLLSTGIHRNQTRAPLLLPLLIASLLSQRTKALLPPPHPCDLTGKAQQCQKPRRRFCSPGTLLGITRDNPCNEETAPAGRQRPKGSHQRPIFVIAVRGHASREEGTLIRHISVLAAKLSSLSFQLKLLFEAVCLQAQPHESLLS